MGRDQREGATRQRNLDRSLPSLGRTSLCQDIEDRICKRQGDSEVDEIHSLVVLLFFD